MGNTRRAQGFLADAEQLYLKALDIWTSKLGEHWDTALCLHKYAVVLHSQGKEADAM